MAAKSVTKREGSKVSKLVSGADILKSVSDNFGSIAATALMESLCILDDAPKKIYNPQDCSKTDAIMARIQIKDAMLYFRVLGAGMVSTDPENEKIMETLLEWSKECQDVLDYKKPIKANLRK